MLRTPMLPFDELPRWSEGLSTDDLDADRTLLRERLQRLVSRPEVNEAIHVASPSLHASLDGWLRAPEGKRGRATELALVRYLARMVGRATPFGLFAGTTLGKTAEDTRLELPPRERYRRCTRLDMLYLTDLVGALERIPEVRRSLRYHASSGLYRVGDRYRYAEARPREGGGRSYHLMAMKVTPPLQATLERAATAASFDELANALAVDDPELDRAEIDGFLDELIDDQLLVSELALNVTGSPSVETLMETLRTRAVDSALVARLDEALTTLAAADSGGLGGDTEHHRVVCNTLSELPAELDESRLLQVDLFKPGDGVTLGANVLDEIKRGVRLLQRLTGSRGRDSLTEFHDAFYRRYGDREVPLVEALDSQLGIGFGEPGMRRADPAPLIKGLKLDSAAGPAMLPWGGSEKYMTRKLLDALASGTDEIEIDESELLERTDLEPATLPAAFSVNAVLCARSVEAVAGGEFRVLLLGGLGPSGARMMGRFCHGDEDLQRVVRAHCRDEERHSPDAIFAEIAHLPEGRIGNIVSRPLLRDFEIPYLGRSGAPRDRQISVTDLMLSVAQGRLILRSRRLGREVVPRLTTAHNFVNDSLDIYRFLCALQDQGCNCSLSWNWGPFEGARHLPRVVSGRLVLRRARWTLDGKEIRALATKRDVELYRRFVELRREIGLPRYVALADGDNELVVDTDNPMSVDAFVDSVSGRPYATLVEMFPDPEQLCVRGPEGRFVHELVIPFREEPLPAKAASIPERNANVAAKRCYPPGSEWLYIKLYCGTAAADDVLRRVIAPVLDQAIGSGWVDRWFFIRFEDPDPHLRLRFHGDPGELLGALLPVLRDAADPFLIDETIRGFQLDTYAPEIDRYGGARGASLAETLFQADSEATLGLLRLLGGDAGEKLRWLLTLRGLHDLLVALRLDFDTRFHVVSTQRRSFAEEFKVAKPQRIQLGNRFRQHRREAESIVAASPQSRAELAPALALLRRRSDAISKISEELSALDREGELGVPIPELARSYLHMHVNRMIRSAQRTHELVLYDFLQRIYESEAARARYGARAV